MEVNKKRVQYCLAVQTVYGSKWGTDQKKKAIVSGKGFGIPM